MHIFITSFGRWFLRAYNFPPILCQTKKNKKKKKAYNDFNEQKTFLKFVL